MQLCRRLAPFLSVIVLAGALGACGGGGGGGGSSSPPPPSAPATPAGLNTAVLSDTSIKVTWSASTGATGYTLYRDGSVIASPSATTYTDQGLTPATTYHYAIAATAAGLSSATSTAVSATTAPGIPAAPTGLVAGSVTASQVVLNWTAAANASGYVVYRNGTALAGATPASTTYTDTTVAGGTSYQYTVAASDAAGTSAPSAPLAVTTPVPLAQTPAVPGGLLAVATSNTTVALTWSAVAPTQSGTVTYQVFRDNVGIAIHAGAATSYTDSGLAQASTHSYTVQAVDPAGHTSGVSAPQTVTTPGPAQPGNLQAMAMSNTQVSLTWSAPADTLPITGYQIIRQAAGGGSTTLVSGSNLAGYLDTTAVQGTSYTYRVVARDAGPYSSPASAAASVTLPGPSAPATLTATTTGTASIQLGWSAASDTLGVTGYRIYRQPTGGGAATLLASVPSTNAVDGSLLTAGSYTYTVVAYDAQNYTATSPAATAAVTLTGPGIYTYHADNARTGQNLSETTLSAANVTGGAHFGKLYACALDGAVYAQPLFASHVALAGGVTNLVYVATMNDSVYAFAEGDTTCTPVWKNAYATGAVAAAPPVADPNSHSTCDDIPNQYGITGTPVIDPVTNTMYFVAKTYEASAYVQRLHAVDIATGAERTGSPVLITASVPTQAGGSVVFDPQFQNQRAGLALANGNVYIGWGAHCDFAVFSGWVMAYDKLTLAQTGVLNTTPNGPASGGRGGVWMSGGAPGIDSSGALYITTGNGTFDAGSQVITPYAPLNDYGESYLKLAGNLGVTDFYTPSQNQAWTTSDADLSSSGVTVLPNNAGPAGHPNMVVGSDKQGHLWLLDRGGASGAGSTTMGGFNPGTENVVQYVQLPYPPSGACVGLYSQGTVTYWNNTLYTGVSGGKLLAITLSAGLIPAGAGSPGTVTPTQQSAEAYGFPVPTMMISAASPSAGSAILWALDNNANGVNNCNGPGGPPILRAYDATSLSTLYSSDAVAGDAPAGVAVKFQVPVIANGHVYVAATDSAAGSGQLTVYGVK